MVWRDQFIQGVGSFPGQNEGGGGIIPARPPNAAISGTVYTAPNNPTVDTPEGGKLVFHQKKTFPVTTPDILQCSNWHVVIGDVTSCIGGASGFFVASTQIVNTYEEVFVFRCGSPPKTISGNIGSTGDGSAISPDPLLSNIFNVFPIDVVITICSSKGAVTFGPTDPPVIPDPQPIPPFTDQINTLAMPILDKKTGKAPTILMKMVIICDGYSVFTPFPDLVPISATINPSDKWEVSWEQQKLSDSSGKEQIDIVQVTQPAPIDIPIDPGVSAGFQGPTTGHYCVLTYNTRDGKFGGVTGTTPPNFGATGTWAYIPFQQPPPILPNPPAATDLASPPPPIQSGGGQADD
jgi:hypothetical protein